MTGISMETGFLLAGILFVIGLTGVMIRRNIVFILMSVEIMLNAAGMAFIFAGAAHHQPDGQAMFIFILAVAAAEVSVGLALAVIVFRRFKSLDIDKLSSMKG